MKNKASKIGRNQPCPCGSGLKYKRCCAQKSKAAPAAVDLADKYRRKYKIRLKSAQEIEGIRKAGRLVLKTLAEVEQIIRPGITTDEINALVHDFTLKHGARPAPLNYRGFPKSVCTSINEVICHGIPGDRMLEDGDILNVDVTSILDGFYADANKTYLVGNVSADARKITAVAAGCLRDGMAMVKPGNTLGDIGWAIQRFAESHGCSVVREFVGHGIGFDFHEPPQVLHYGKRAEGIELVPGMVFTIEPMINLGQRHLRILDDGWTAITADGSLSAQFEQTVWVTQDGVESLTPYDLDLALPDAAASS